jgi:hypothetical protein
MRNTPSVISLNDSASAAATDDALLLRRLPSRALRGTIAEMRQNLLGDRRHVRARQPGGSSISVGIFRK